MVEQDGDRKKWECNKQQNRVLTKMMGFEQTVEQDPDRIKWELIKWQNSFMRKKDEVLANGRIISNLRQKKMKVQ